MAHFTSSASRPPACLEMICADFLAGAAIEVGNPEILLQSISRYYRFLPGEQQEVFRSEVTGSAS